MVQWKSIFFPISLFWIQVVSVINLDRLLDNIQACLYNGYRQIFYWPQNCFLFLSLYYCRRIYNITKICLLLTDAAWLHVWDKTVGAQKLNLIPNNSLPSNKWKNTQTYNSIMKYNSWLIINSMNIYTSKCFELSTLRYN